MKTKAATDRRVLRTRRTLRDSLVQLILQRGWDEVTVRDICARADVGRSTFYTHFADKEELLLSGFDDLRVALRTQQAPGAAGPLAFAGSMIVHASENLRLFRALVGRRSALAVQAQFKRVVIDLVREDLSHTMPKQLQVEAATHYLAGAFIELLSWWLDTRTGLSATQLEELFHNLSSPVVATLKGHAF